MTPERVANVHDTVACVSSTFVFAGSADGVVHALELRE
jgi:hypothetical protein